MTRANSPAIFRILVGAKDLERSRRFYEALLGVRGRRVADGRVYFDCGGTILGVLDHSRDKGTLGTPTEAIYLSTSDLEGVHRRARRLGCLSRELLHGDPGGPMGEILVRPWGERSFYVEDPAGNPLCFVDRSTLFRGTPAQIAALERASGPPR
jgi:catechol 2,3-dioxygenase-like lactoylglutathione lyase family enzyme